MVIPGVPGPGCLWSLLSCFCLLLPPAGLSWLLMPACLPACKSPGSLRPLWREKGGREVGRAAGKRKTDRKSKARQGIAILLNSVIFVSIFVALLEFVYFLPNLVNLQFSG